MTTRKRREFVFGVGLFILAVVIIIFLLFRQTLLAIEITNPTSDKPISVKAVSNGTAGKYAVTGYYTGKLSEHHLKIYILVRSTNSDDEEWYIQEGQAVVTKEDGWFTQGQWKFDEAYVGTGSGKENERLQRDEVWELLALIANENLPKFDKIPPDKLNEALTPLAQSQILQLKIGDINP
jgi:hypothetical protein